MKIKYGKNLDKRNTIDEIPFTSSIVLHFLYLNKNLDLNYNELHKIVFELRSYANYK